VTSAGISALAPQLELPVRIAPGGEAAGGRVPALDGLRGVAALMVMCYHFGPHIAAKDSSAFSFLRVIPPFWFEGVDLFFVLSGFLISGILVSQRDSPRYFRTFYARRALRIFPVYYIVLGSYLAAILYLGSGTAGLGRLFENPLPLWSYVLYVQNFSMAHADNFGAFWMAASWSLAVEEQFYFTLPALVRLVSEKMLFRFALAAVFVAPLLRGIIQKTRFVHGLAMYVSLPTCIDSLALGVLVMLLLKWHRPYLQARRKNIAWAVLAAFTFWSLYPFLPNPQAIRMAFLERTGNAIVFAGVILLILIAPDGWLARVLSHARIRGFGNLAYSTYLLHPILLCVAFQMLKGKDPALRTVSDLGPVFLAGAATLALSFASRTFLERRLIRIGHRFQY
jgi:peptidoglycan/LPS O-acetylase OafA/YrhL